MLRNKLGKWIKKDPTREHEMMADNEAVYVNKGGKIKKHMIIQRERRRIIFFFFLKRKQRYQNMLTQQIALKNGQP